MQAALLEDDVTLQDKWAALLANASDPRQEESVLTGFISVLSELTPNQARFLDVSGHRFLPG